MNVADIWTEIEAEQTWRQDEIRFFQNQSTFVDADKQDQFRKALVLLLYAHFEGFCKFALTLYVNNINTANIRCGDANHAIAAASFSDLFKALRNPEKKCPEFRNSLPDDTTLHRFSRERDFVECANQFDQRIVSIPEDIVDTDSNLKPVVLRKILYRLGLAHDHLASVEGRINKLLNYRNKIAHGESTSGVGLDDYTSLRDAAFEVMNEVKRLVLDALQNGHYLRNC